MTSYVPAIRHVLEHLDLAHAALMVDHGRPAEAAQMARDEANAATCHLRVLLESYPLPAPAAALLELDGALSALRGKGNASAALQIRSAVSGLRAEVEFQEGQPPVLPHGGKALPVGVFA